MVVSDHLMPGMSGAQLFEVLRRERATLPLILASGFAERPDDLDAATVKLAKPFDRKELACAIALALNGVKSPARPASPGPERKAS
jgi:CheY-like chemotaxis protein